MVRPSSYRCQLGSCFIWVCFSLSPSNHARDAERSAFLNVPHFAGCSHWGSPLSLRGQRMSPGGTSWRFSWSVRSRPYQIWRITFFTCKRRMDAFSVLAQRHRDSRVRTDCSLKVTRVIGAFRAELEVRSPLCPHPPGRLLRPCHLRAQRTCPWSFRAPVEPGRSSLRA